jgi:hypothetical protein
MRHFGTQYCDKKIFRLKDKKTFFNQYFYQCVNWKYLFLSMDTRVCTENHNIWNVITIFWRRNYLFISISFYLNIFLSQYCASKCLVWIRPYWEFWTYDVMRKYGLSENVQKLINLLKFYASMIKIEKVWKMAKKSSLCVKAYLWTAIPL